MSDPTPRLAREAQSATGVFLAELTPADRERLERALQGQLMNVELYGLGDGRRLAPREVDKLAREVCAEVRR